MICPRCGENNPDNFRFCGMCGDALQGVTPQATEPATEKAGTAATRPDSMVFTRMESRGSGKTATLTATAPRTEPSHTSQRLETIAGPSLLGLDQPTPESIRETTFRGMTTYYPEERGVAWGRIVIALFFVAALVGVGWWRYKNYGIPGTGKPPSWLSAMNKTTPPGDNPAPEIGNKAANQNADQSKNQQTNNQAGDQNSSATGETANAEKQASDSAVPADQKNSVSDKTNDNKPAEGSSGATPEKPGSKVATSADESNQGDEAAAAAEKPAKAGTRTRNTASDNAAAAKPSPAVADATGDALFRKGAAYLYGQGVPENCDQAIRYLKSASAQNNAKARSTFGTMYATGHCVPRDLPSSYRWFALALQADPNNSILEKDLTAVWNQMTPPERQLATRMKPGE